VDNLLRRACAIPISVLRRASVDKKAHEDDSGMMAPYMRE
jgi:hypothetical protein